MSDEHEEAITSRRGRTRRGARVAVLLVALAAIAAAAASLAYGQLPGPLNDLFALGQGGGDSPQLAETVTRPEPPFVPTPLVKCGPGSHEEPGVDGRVPEGSAANGLNCKENVAGRVLSARRAG